MRKLTFTTAISALILAALACGPRPQTTPAPPVDEVPRPTDTTAPIPAVETPTDAPPPQDGSGVGGTPVSNEPGDNTLEGFRQALLDNINSRNYDYLMYAMNDPFSFGFWASEGYAQPPSEAIETLRNNYLTPENIVSYDLDKDLTTMLGGTPPERVFGPDVNIVDAVWMNGWGKDGSGEVIIFISQTPEGYFTWHGLIYARQGFK